MNEFEAQMASLRKTESMLETLRQKHYASTEAVQVAQAQYYESNADVANLETQVKHTQEARDRLTLQLEQTLELSLKADNQTVDLDNQLHQLNIDLSVAEEQLVLAEGLLNKAKQAFPEAERAYSSAQRSHSDAQRTLSEAEQSIRIEANHNEHIGRSILEMKQRLDRLNAENSNLKLPDENDFSAKQAELKVLEVT